MKDILKKINEKEKDLKGTITKIITKVILRKVKQTGKESITGPMGRFMMENGRMD
jgi:hypothetical protein